MNDTLCLKVDEQSAVGEAQRRAAGISRRLGFGEDATGRVSIVARELASNMIKHAGGGLMVVQPQASPGSAGIELLALDAGPGMRNVGESLRDGHSTAGSSGTGLGAVRRFSSVFDIYAPPGAGTAVFSRIKATATEQAPRRGALPIGAVCVPVHGEDVCGDAWAVHETAARSLILLADGLGHGRDAAKAADQAVQTFRVRADHGLAEILTALDAALRPTRGAALAVAEIVPERDVVTVAGLGNIGGAIYGGGAARRLATSEGTAGSGTREAVSRAFPWPADGMLILHSDGLSARWDLDDYAGLRRRHPALIAGVLFRDHRRLRDDASVVVVARPKETP